MSDNITIYQSDLSANKNPVLLYINELQSPRSKATMLQSLHTVARILLDDRTADAVELGRLWANLKHENIVWLQNTLSQRYAPATTNRLITAVKRTLYQCWRLELLTIEEYSRIVDVKPVKGERPPAGRDIKRDELVLLLRTCWDDPHPAGVRDAAIIAVLWACGLRRAELTALTLEDYRRDEKIIRVLRGKGNKWRDVALSDTAMKALDKWTAKRGDAPGPLWYKFTRVGQMLPEAISSQGIYDMLKRRVDRAGVDDMMTHDFRRSAAGDLLDAGADIVTVQKMLGHSDVSTTARYDRRGQAAQQRAANLRQLPEEE